MRHFIFLCAVSPCARKIGNVLFCECDWKSIGCGLVEMLKTFRTSSNQKMSSDMQKVMQLFTWVCRFYAIFNVIVQTCQPHRSSFVERKPHRSIEQQNKRSNSFWKIVLNLRIANFSMAIGLLTMADSESMPDGQLVIFHTIYFDKITFFTGSCKWPSPSVAPLHNCSFPVCRHSNHYSVCVDILLPSLLHKTHSTKQATKGRPHHIIYITLY